MRLNTTKILVDVIGLGLDALALLIGVNIFMSSPNIAEFNYLGALALTCLTQSISISLVNQVDKMQFKGTSKEVLLSAAIGRIISHSFILTFIYILCHI